MLSIEKTSGIVFAGSRGIGRATALRLAKEGIALIIGYASNKKAADEVVHLIESSGGKAVAVKVDVANAMEVKAAFEEAIKQFGNIDIVINAAAVSVFGPHVAISEQEFARAFAVNASGTFHVLRQAATHIRDKGRIVQFSTGGTKMSMAGTGIYAASKAAGEHMALALAKELGARGVTVNVVSPGVTETDGLVMPKEQLVGLVAQTPLGRLGQPSDIADGIAFLISEDARWVTGQNIQINGGIL